MLTQASHIAREAGALLRKNFGQSLKVNEIQSHDMKLQLDVDCQRLIENYLRKEFPDHSIVGEEESHGDPHAEYRWIVDPLDGTVNFAHGIPHFCVSIALQKRLAKDKDSVKCEFKDYESIVGVVYDPMRDELFSAEKGKGAFMNGKPIHVSKRELKDAIITIGFSRTEETIRMAFENLQKLIRSVMKVRTMGAAALDLAYVSAGRLEAYLEFKVKLWDVAAGMLIAKEAGGTVLVKALPEAATGCSALVSNGIVKLGAEKDF